jgi:hypothetical protein
MFTIDSRLSTGYSPKPANSLGPALLTGCLQTCLTFALKASAFFPFYTVPLIFDVQPSLANEERNGPKYEHGAMRA